MNASIIKRYWLIMYKETIAVYCKNYTEHINTACSKTQKFFVVEPSGTVGLTCVPINLEE